MKTTQLREAFKEVFGVPRPRIKRELRNGPFYRFLQSLKHPLPVIILG